MGTTAQNMRLDVRLGADHKKLIEQAADLLGQTVSAFTVSTLVREAAEVTERFGALRLSDRDRDAFLAACDEASEPNAKLRQAAQAHAEAVGR